MKICLLHCKKHLISLERNIFHVFELYLKLHLATFSHWERSVWASVASHSHHLLRCSKHRIDVLRSSKEVILCNWALKWLFLQKSSNSWKIYLLHCKKTFHFIRKNHFSCTCALLLKLHLATFSHWERSFWASVALHSHHLLSCTKHRICVFRSSKEVILCI